MLLDELLDVPIVHPLRYHCKAPVTRCRPQQREHIRMVETLPHDDFLAESLRNHNQHHSPLECFEQ